MNDSVVEWREVDFIWCVHFRFSLDQLFDARLVTHADGDVHRTIRYICCVLTVAAETVVNLKR